MEGQICVVPEQLQQLLGNCQYWATSIRTHWGLVGDDNLVFFTARGCINIGFAKGFLMTSSGSYLGILQQCAKIDGTTAWKRRASHEIVAVGCIVETGLFVALDDESFVPMNRLA